MFFLLGRISTIDSRNTKEKKEKESMDHVHSSLTKSQSSSVIDYHVGPAMDSRTHVCVCLETMEIDDRNEISTEDKNERQRHVERVKIAYGIFRGVHCTRTFVQLSFSLFLPTKSFSDLEENLESEETVETRSYLFFGQC